MDGGRVDDLAARIVASNPTTARMLQGSVAALADDERRELEAYLAHVAESGAPMDFVAEAYNTIVRDTLREQMFFRRHGRYRYARYDEVANSVYLNDDYMTRYMVGLAVTTFLWPNHLAIHRFFRASIDAAPVGDYLEIGPGHGVFFMTALRSGKFRRCLGVDLSPTSIAMTEALLVGGKFRPVRRLRAAPSRFPRRAAARRAFAAVVMGEVLEHVEEPALFMARIRELRRAWWLFVFITTAINAPAGRDQPSTSSRRPKPSANWSRTPASRSRASRPRLTSA